MPRGSNRGGRNSNSNSGNQNNSDWGVADLVRERPFAAAAAAAGAAAAGLFLWSKRSQISQQISDLSDQIGEWTENMNFGSGDSMDMDDTAGLTTSGSTGSRLGAGSRSASGTRSGTTRSSSGTRGRTSNTASNRGMSETGGGNASLGAHSGGIGTTTTGSPSGRGRAATTENT